MRLLKRLLGKHPRPARAPLAPTFLRTEELEARWNPSNSTNWSGYAVSTAAGAVTAVSGEWTVPTVTGTGTAYSSVWVGIDGYTSTSVEQTGTEADVVNGVAQYYAWYEMYPNASVEVNLAIHAGDTITASVTYSAGTGQFTMTLKDLNDPAGSNTFSISKSGPTLQRSSAEWIVEAPSSNTGVLPLANFGTVTITNASATINGTTGSINNSAWASSVNSINMVSSSGKLEASTGTLNAAGTSFTVTYAAASPPVTPPVSPPPVSPPPVSPPPAPGSVATTTTLTGKVDPNTWVPTVTLTATVSPSVPSGSTVALLVNGTVLGYGRVQKVGGIEEVSFNVEFFQPGTYTFTADYLGSGQYAASVSNSVTVTVTGNAYNYWEYLLASLPGSQRHSW